MSNGLVRSTRFALLGVALTACGDDFALPPASSANVPQTITVFALTGTPVGTPSAYSLLGLIEVRTDTTTNFDFAFDIGPADRFSLGPSTDTIAVLLPRFYFGFSADGGFIRATQPFDSLRLAPLDGYDQQHAVRIDTGSVYFVTSQRQNCNVGIVFPRYAKLRVEQLDYAQRRAVIRLVIDLNCGYRGLVLDSIPNQ